MSRCTRTLARLVPPLVLAAGLHAQLTTIAQAGTNETVQPVTSQLAGLAVTSDGRLWALTHFNDGKGQGAKSQFVRIMSSADNGKTWKVATTTRTTGSIRGSLVTGTDGRTLHVAWRATNGAVGAGIWYAPYDTVKGQWAAPDKQLIAGGSTTNRQYLEPHISTTRKGTLVVSFYQHRQGLWPAWSGGMMFAKAGTWSKPQRVNVDTFGVVIDSMTLGEDVHFAYRTNSGLYGIRYRRFDTAAEKWGAEGEIRISQDNANMVGTASSANDIVVKPNGDTYVVYATGDRGAGKGAIWIGYSKAGAYKFATHVKVADDPPLLGGNHNFWSYSLSLNSDGRVHVLYSLASEGNAKLYMRWMSGARILPPKPVTLAAGQAKQFAWVAGHRTALGHFAFMATALDQSHPGGRALFFGGQANGAVVFHGMGCQGKLSAAPWLGATDLPSVGRTLHLALRDLPQSRPGILFIGLGDRMLGAIPLPLDLGLLQMKGCFLVQDLFVNLVYTSSAQGQAAAAVPLPNDRLLAGLPLYFQAWQIATGANAANALMSNGIAAIAR